MGKGMHAPARETAVKLVRRLPRPLFFLYRLFRHPEDAGSALSFLRRPSPGLALADKAALLKRFYRISLAVDCPHTQQEIISFAEAVLSLPREMPGCLIEAGAFQGGSTAKFSIIAKLAGRRLVTFDSFAGIPDHREPHERDIFGGRASFPLGSYRGSLERVKHNVAAYGEPDVCEFIEGWFDQTMPHFSRPAAAIYLDVDLAASTKTCLKYLYPLLVPGGVLYSQDGHLPLVIEALRDERFWISEVGCPPPPIEGLGRRKLLKIVKSPGKPGGSGGRER